MTAVHRPAILAAQNGWMICFRIIAAAAFALMAIPAQADEEEQQEVYSALLHCAAFHTVEATKADADTSAAQTATAIDYAGAASLFAADGKTVTVDAELKSLLESFRTTLETGEPRKMAEQWTALESACRELHPMKDQLVARRKAELGSTQEAR